MAKLPEGDHIWIIEDPIWYDGFFCYQDMNTGQRYSKVAHIPLEKDEMCKNGKIYKVEQVKTGPREYDYYYKILSERPDKDDDEPTEREIVMEAMDMVKDIPAEDVLVPLQQEDKELTPFPEAEYKVIEAPTMDKLVRDVNNHLKNGRRAEGGVQVSSGNLTRFYQSMIRWNVDANIGPKPEMPSKNSEGDTQGPKPLYIPGLEDEPDLYEDLIEDATN